MAVSYSIRTLTFVTQLQWGRDKGWLHSDGSHLQYLIMFKSRAITQGFKMENKWARQFGIQLTIWWPRLWLLGEEVDSKTDDLSLWLAQSCRITSLYSNFQLFFHRLSFYNSVRVPKAERYKFNYEINSWPFSSNLRVYFLLFCWFLLCFILGLFFALVGKKWLEDLFSSQC